MMRCGPGLIVVADRPVSVIDFENREQVARLLTAYYSRLYGGSPDDPVAPDETLVADMQAALRECAGVPPRVDEPTWLGAVVEDAEGQLWVRSSKYVTSHRNDWYRAGGTAAGSDCRHWDGIAAVRVLSEGVPT